LDAMFAWRTSCHVAQRFRDGLGKAYDQQFVVVKDVVRSAATRINLSFDL
jgi:hypothetical protein